MMLSGQSVWVVGAGFLGQVLAAQCAAAGAEVLVIDVNPAVAPHVCGDSSEPATYARARCLAGRAPAAIFCCIATRGGSIDDYRRCYVGTTRALMQSDLAGRCVFCSSTSVYGGDSERTALLLEAEAHILNVGGCVARLVPLYGPGRCELLRRHLAGEPRLPGALNRVLNYVHVEDAAAALLLLAEREVSGVCDVCGESFTKSGVYALLSQLTGISAAAEDAPPSKRSSVSTPIAADALRALGWRPRHGFADFVSAQQGK